MKTNGNQWKSMEIHGNQLKYNKTNETRSGITMEMHAFACESIETNGIQWKSMKTNGNPCKCMQINGNQWKSMKTNGIQWKSMKKGLVYQWKFIHMHAN